MGDGERARRGPRPPLVLGLLLLLGVAPVTLVRLTGFDRVTPAAQLVGFAPVATVAVVLAAVLLAVHALRGGGPWPVAVAAVLLVAHVGWLVAPVLDTPDEQAGPRGTTAVAVNLLSVNARFGNADAGQVVRAVREHDVAVLVVQELTPELADDLAEEGLEELLPHVVGTTAVGPIGSATYARWPQQDLGAPRTTFTTVRSRVDVPATDGLVVTNVHTWPPLPGTVDLWRDDHQAIAAAIADDTGHRVLAGDLNATPDHSYYRRLLQRSDLAPAGGAGLWAPTWPSDRPYPPLLRLDHVLVDPGTSAGGSARLDVDGTDHLALLVRLGLSGRD